MAVVYDPKRNAVVAPWGQIDVQDYLALQRYGPLDVQQSFFNQAEIDMWYGVPAEGLPSGLVPEQMFAESTHGADVVSKIESFEQQLTGKSSPLVTDVVVAPTPGGAVIREPGGVGVVPAPVEPLPPVDFEGAGPMGNIYYLGGKYELFKSELEVLIWLCRRLRAL